jgi:hypothetical protein
VTIPLMFDVLIVVLLAATIGYAIQLSGRLAALRKDRGELDAMAKRFAEAAQRAESAIAALKATSETAGKALDQATAKAQGLRDDLSFMIERGEPLADRLTGSLTAAMRQAAPRDAGLRETAPREVAAPQPAPAAPAAPAPARAAAHPDSATPQRDLRRALANLR